ncbi:WxcM-like domain-containing protein [Thioclava nitratireducens]|uniref:WxcM-like domain-containing protein n=1 Tax=Thioclava nitratireducens TaxID=1915078 RepID=UPI0024814518|nr:WxcM-like domain-containing protein [Thioclava nitratireducens]WGT51488.1 WxcM-like domain-containing protein [Thioclava nitratireducens]
MTRPNSIAQDCILPDDAIVEEGVSIGPRVVLAGSRITIRERAKIEAAAVIGEGVIIGQGAVVRAGAVVLRSIPANSIVEGNPAQVVGYARSSVREEADAPRHVDINSTSDISRPGRISLGVDESALYLMRRVTDARGALTVGEVPSEVPFAPARYFAVFDVPSVELRGEHAHKQCQQFLICLNGTCRVLLDNGEERCEVTLDRPDMGVFMPEMIWGTQYRYSRDAVLLVFASHTYDANDYIRDYDEFIRERKRLLK